MGENSTYLSLGECEESDKDAFLKEQMLELNLRI